MQDSSGRLPAVVAGEVAAAAVCGWRRRSEKGGVEDFAPPLERLGVLLLFSLFFWTFFHVFYHFYYFLFFFKKDQIMIFCS